MATDRLRETNGWLVIRVIEFLGTITIRSALVSQLSFRVRRRASLELELVALRHQVTVLRRQRPGQLWLFSEEDQVPPIPGGPSVARHGNLSALGPHRLAALEQEKYLVLMAELRRVIAIAWPAILKISPETHSLFSASPRFASCSESFV